MVNKKTPFLLFKQRKKTKEKKTLVVLAKT